jgi:transposase
MAKILCEERVTKYSVEFKIKVVNLTYKLDVDTIGIAEALDLYSVMVYRWRLEYREGKLIPQPTRRISMTKDKSTLNPKIDTRIIDELKSPKKECAKLRKENDFLKKWQTYQRD